MLWQLSFSEKFRIFNAKQFLESLSEGANDADAARTRMYFFVGRSARWDAYLEIFNISGTFSTGETVSGGGWSGTVAEVNENSLLITNVLQPQPQHLLLAPQSQVLHLVLQQSLAPMRYATEEAPPTPLDNYSEKLAIYNELVAAKRITAPFARLVVPRYNWNLTLNPKFDMYRPNYAPTPGGGGAVGKDTATGQSSLSEGKFYVMNSQYEVFKCIYNGESATIQLVRMPHTNQSLNLLLVKASFANGIYSEPAGTAGYIWKHMFTVPTGDVLAFLSTDFMPIVESTELSRTQVEALAVDGAIHVAVIKDAGSALPASATLYTSVKGDGSGAVVKLTTDASGSVTGASMEAIGSGYSYGNLTLVTGEVFTDSGLTAAAGAFSGTAAIELVISPKGGHGSDAENELFAKRIMTNIRLTYDEGAGDFPVDNDFRRIGIIQDPYNYGTTDFADSATLRGTSAMVVTSASSDYTVDEDIFQAVSGGTAFGKVVSWDSSAGVLKYYQSLNYIVTVVLLERLNLTLLMLLLEHPPQPLEM